MDRLKQPARLSQGGRHGVISQFASATAWLSPCTATGRLAADRGGPARHGLGDRQPWLLVPCSIVLGSAYGLCLVAGLVEIQRIADLFALADHLVSSPSCS